MEYILKYIDENLSQHLTLASVAAYAGYSTWHFCDKFKAATGMTFTEYLRSRRMQYAANALLRGGTISDIAYNAGYETVAGFEKAFYKYYGCQSAQYRQRSAFYQARYETLRGTRPQLSDRCQILRERMANPATSWDYAIGRYSYCFWQGFYGVPPERRTNYSTQAAGFASILRGIFPVIHDGELIVGDIFPSEHIERMERGMIDLIREAPAKALSYLQRGQLSAEQRGELFSWAARSDCRWPVTEGITHLGVSPKQRLQQKDGAAIGDCTVDAHSVPDYEKVLRQGFDGILSELQAAAAEDVSERQREFLGGCIRVCEACCGVGDKYAVLAAQLALQERDETRRLELQMLADICTQVPRHPACTFREAIQSLYFAHMLNTLEDGVNANSLGRIDQLLYPYYQRDIAEGRITKQAVFELICCLWLKLYRPYDVQQCTLGGCDTQGRDAVNELSHLFLDATEELDMVRCLSVRYGKNTERRFLLRSFEVLSHLNKGINSFYNDDVFIPALTRRGISEADARNYAVIGCAEMCIPGKSNVHPVSARCNLLKALEYALTGGECMTNPGQFPGLRRGSRFRSFAALKRAVLAQLDALLDTAAYLTQRMTKIRAQEWPQFYKSFLTDGCIERRRSYCNHGARYDFDEVMLLGLPNLADALLGVKRLVFDRRSHTLEELVAAMRDNFSDTALLDEILYTVPKFGNGIKEVDELAAELMAHACLHLEALHNDSTDGYFAQMLSYRWSIDHGALTPATPDGRRRGEPLADGVSPMTERDLNGVAAVLQSVGTLPAVLSPGGFCASICVDSFLFSDCHLELILDLFLQASAAGLGSLQFNIQDAQPSALPMEAERKLAVQVFGYRQQYNQLDEEIRTYIRERTKHQLL